MSRHCVRTVASAQGQVSTPQSGQGTRENGRDRRDLGHWEALCVRWKPGWGVFWEGVVAGYGDRFENLEGREMAGRGDGRQSGRRHE